MTVVDCFSLILPVEFRTWKEQGKIRVANAKEEIMLQIPTACVDMHI